ncbi:MAG TPA: PEGA domain-containing protein, partial [Verrucomicrobiae bacterium]|nr:PEGA domain-containing protein [Verrucomicrobiae bacterium]
MEAMDLMDPRRRLGHNIRLMIGYVLVGIALLLLTIILLFVAYGFGLQNGKVIQSGLLFLSSTPNPAHVYLNGVQYQNDTNTKLLLQEATYRVTLTRAGYRDWERPISVVGGQVEFYRYPFLFPLDLTAIAAQTYQSAPTLVSESNDQNWLLVSQAGKLDSFDVYNLANPGQKPTVITLPAGTLTTAAGVQSLAAVAWANDDNHLLLKHTYGPNTEYLLLNRSSPASSQNITKILQLPPTGITLSLNNGQSDHYLVYDATSQVLSQNSLGSPSLVPLVDHILAFAADNDSSDTIAYVTPDSTNPLQVSVMIYNGGKKYLIRHEAAGQHYLLAATDYSGDTYVAISAEEANTAYVYKDPVEQITDPRFGVAVPAQAFTVTHPTYAGFSISGQYAVFENGARFAVYDVDNDQGFSYNVTDSLDSPMTHAEWMDGARLYYISHSQVVVFDYDGRNRQVLTPADSRYPLFFDSNYKFMYAFTTDPANKLQEILTTTSLRTKADQ